MIERNKITPLKLCYLDWASDDGKLGGLHAGAHVEHHVLVSYVGQGPDIRQPGLDLLVIPGRAAVDDDLSVPPALVDGGQGPGLDRLSKLELTVLDPELAEEDVHHIVGVGPGQGAQAVGEHGAGVARDGAGAVPAPGLLLLILAVHRLGEVIRLVPEHFPPPIRLCVLSFISSSPCVQSHSLRGFTGP